jgi:hypothetical protein
MENEEWFLKLNQFYDSSSKHVFVFLTTQNWLGTFRIYQFLKWKKSENKYFCYIFNKLSALIRVKDKIIGIMSSIETRFLLVIVCDEDLNFKQYSFVVKIKEILKNQCLKLILVGQNSNNFIDVLKTNEFINLDEFQLTASFKDLSLSSQNSLLMVPINFQGKEILLKELVPIDKPEILKTIDLDKLLKGEALKMGQSDIVSADYKNLSDCYIERSLYLKNQLDLKKFIKYFENIFEELKLLLCKEFENENMNFVINEEQNSFENAMSNWFVAHDYTLKTSENLNLFLCTQLIELSSKIKEKSKKTASQIGEQTLDNLNSSEKSKIELIVKNYFETNHSADKIVINNNVEENYIDFCNNYENSNVHWLVESATGIHWKKTHGSINFIREYLIESQERIPENALMDAHVGQIVIISDVPGMGKSTILSSLITKNLQSSAQKWQIRINLNDFTNVFNAKKPVENAFDYLSKDILNIVDPFELALLYHHCHTLDKSIIFVDGFDEICPTYECIVLDFITKLFMTIKSRIVVTTRPERRLILENKLNQIAHNLEIFNKKDQLNFLIHSWIKTKKIPNDEHHKKILTSFGEHLIGAFQNSINENDSRLIGIPLLTRMLSEIYKDVAIESVISQNVNLSQFQRQLRLLDIYEKFISKKTSIFFNEKAKSQKQVRGVLEKEILNWHQLLALKQLLTEKELNMLLNKKANELNENFVLRFGLVLKNNNKLIFIHRTFAEYFAFLFFKNNLKDDKVAKFIVKTIFCNQVQNTICREFFNNYFEVLVEKKSIEIKILELYGQCFLDRENGLALKIAASETRSNVFKFILNCFEARMMKDKSGKYYLKTICLETQLHFDVISNFDVKVLETFLQFVNKHLGIYAVKEMLRQNHKNGFNLFFFPTTAKTGNHLENFQALVKFSISALRMDKTNKFLFGKTDYGSNIIFELIKADNEIVLRFLIEYLATGSVNLIDVLCYVDKYSENLMHHIFRQTNSAIIEMVLTFIKKFGKSNLKKLLLTENQYKLNPLNVAIELENNDSNIKIILKFIQDEVDSDTLIEIFSQPSVHGERILHRATAIQMNVKTIENLFNVLKNKTNSQQFHQILFLRDDFSETFMNDLIRFQPESNIQLLLTFLKDQLGFKLFQKFLYDKESQCSRTLFFEFLFNSESKLKYFVTFLKDQFGKQVIKEMFLFQNKLNRNILHFSVESSNRKLGFLIEHLKQELNKYEIKELLLAKDVDVDNPFCRAVRFPNNDSNIEIILKFIQDDVDSDTLIEIFSQPSVKGRLILHLATAVQMNVKTIEILFNVLKNKTNSQQFHQILLLQDDFSQTFMNYLIQYQSEWNIQLLLPFVENQLGSKLLQKCLFDKESQCSPALFSAFRSNSESKIKYFLNFLKNQFGKKVFKEIFLFQNKQKRNILHFNVEDSNLNLCFLIEHLKQELNKNEIRELLLAKDVDEENPLFRAVGFTNNDSNIEIILKFIQDEVDSDTVIEIFSQPSFQGNRILQWATAKQMYSETIKSLFNVLNNKTKSQQFHQILFSQDDFSQTFMNYLIHYQSEWNIQLLLPFVENQLGSKLLQKCLFDKESQCSPALFSAFRSNSESKIKYFLNFLKEQFGKQVLKEMFLFQNKQNRNILHFNVEPSNSKLCFLIEHLKQELNKNEIKELLLARDVQNYNPFFRAVGWTNNDSNIEIILKFIQDEVDSDTVIEIFSQPSDHDRRILHRAIQNQMNVATIKSLFNVLKNKTNSQQFHQILLLQDDFSETFMNYLIRFRPESNIQLLLTFLKNQLGSKLFQESLYDKESQSSPALFSAFFSNSEFKIKYFLNFLKNQFGKKVFKEIFLFQNKQKRNILHFNVEDSNLNLCFLIEHLKQELNKNEIRELLLAKDVDEENPLFRAVGFENNDSNIELILKFIQDEVNSDTLIEIFSQPSALGRRILHRASAIQMNVKTIESLFNVLKNKTNSQQFHQILFLQDDFSTTFMNDLIRFQSESNFQLLLPFVENQFGSKCIFQKCLYDKESQCSPVLFSAFLSNSESKIKYFLNFLKEQFGKKVFKEMFLFQNKQKRNILHFNVEPLNSKLCFLIEHLKQELNKNEIKELLLAKDFDDQNPYCRAVGITKNDSNVRIMKELFEEYNDNLLSVSSFDSNNS